MCAEADDQPEAESAVFAELPPAAAKDPQDECFVEAALPDGLPVAAQPGDDRCGPAAQGDGSAPPDDLRAGSQPEESPQADCSVALPVDDHCGLAASRDGLAPPDDSQVGSKPEESQVDCSVALPVDDPSALAAQMADSPQEESPQAARSRGGRSLADCLADFQADQQDERRLAP